MLKEILATAVAVALSVHPSGLWAQEATPGAFTFKRVGPPKTNARPKLVQIDPDAPQYFQTPQRDPRAPRLSDSNPALVATAPDAIANGSDDDLPFPGFWQRVSPALADADPARLDAALAELVRTNVAGTNGQGFALMADLAVRYGELIEDATEGTDVSPAFVLSVIAVESAGRPAAVSGAGAVGLMQLIPATAERFGVEDSTDPAQNIKGGVAYLGWLLDHFDGDPLLALAGYNAGEGAVTRNKGVPPFAETRAYVPKVLGAWRAAKLLCSPQPQSVSDACEVARPKVSAVTSTSGSEEG